jgi:hypothetical protein
VSLDYQVLASVMDATLISILPDPAALADQLERRESHPYPAERDRLIQWLREEAEKRARWKAEAEAEQRRKVPDYQEPDVETPCPVCRAPVEVTLVRHPGDPDELEIEPSCECQDSPLVDAVGYREAIEDRFICPMGGFDLDRKAVAA